MSIQTRTSARTKSKPQPFTPAKYENFSINKTRALDKKLEACNRTMDIKIEQKHQNYILELSAAAYKIIKGGNRHTLNNTLHTSSCQNTSMIIKGYASEHHIRSEIEVVTDNSIIEEQINKIKRNEADIEIRAKQNESLLKATAHQPKTNHSNRILISKGAECIQNTDEELLSN
ncbi:unnamed protein product [Mytilus coruscus]|uniref:Uncharacterized protein n=1 Tax=Mytilus coruscus TaxID=42192 RepID=A0A6J8EFB1_MYTCO|nr:unnamed protein product [Mytilus coruscus]